MMSINKDAKKLIESHKELYNELIAIPDSRKVIFRIDAVNKKKIGKPRFDPPTFKLPEEIAISLRNHLQNIWNFFSKYSYWFDDTIIPLIHINERRTSKKSIFYLLEQDTWCTDEIYGDYLIEKTTQHTNIYYFRRNQKRKKFQLSSTSSDEEIKDWICNNIVTQIKSQIKFIWNSLEKEISICQNEEYIRLKSNLITLDELKNQFVRSKKIIDDHPISALLSIGRISELWLLNGLNEQHKNPYDDLIRMAKTDGLITDHQEKLLGNIRRNYNGAKHKLYYKINKTQVKEFYRQFSILVE
jgi:hypothetical protein